MENQEVKLEQKDNKGKTKRIFVDGIIKQNPLFRLVLALCPSVVVTATLLNALYMGVATLFVLVLATAITNLLGPYIDGKIRIPVFLIVISSLVIIVRMVFQYVEVNFGIPIYSPIAAAINLIVVNCLILGRVEGFATKKDPETGGKANSLFHATMDGLSNGVGYALALMAVALFREVLGSGTIFGISLHPIISSEGGFMAPISIFANLSGGLMAIGIVMAIFNQVYKMATRPKAPKKAVENTVEEVA